jgi:hypothetical protein
MGLFKRKRIIAVASVIYPLGDEPDNILDVVKAGITTASIRKTSAAQAVRSSIMEGMGVKLAQGYNYARNNYYLGMPTSVPQTFLSKDDPILELLCEEHLRGVFTGNTVDVVSTTVSLDNDYDTVVRGLIFSEYDYDFYEDATFATNGSVQTGASLVLSPPMEDADHPGEVGYHLTFTNPDTSVVEIDEWYDEALFESAARVVERVIMEYTLDGGPHQTYSYESGNGDARINIFLRSLTTPASGTFPAMVLKKNNKYLDTDSFSGEPWKTSAAYLTTRSYARRMDLNVDDLMDRIRESESDSDIDYVFVQPGSLINATNREMIKYHYNYFNRIRLAMPDNKPAFDEWMSLYSFDVIGDVVDRNKAENMPAQSIRIKDPEDNAHKTVDMELAWRYISYEEKSGVLADDYVVECGPEEITISKWQSRIPIEEEFDTSKLYFRKRLTADTYAEITVCGAWHENYVYKGRSVQSSAYRAFNDPEGEYGTGFIIPLDYNVLIMLTPRERLQFAQECFHIVFNCYVSKKQKWYQTGFFKVILGIIAVVAIYFSWGAATPWVTGLYTALTVAGLSAIAATIIVALVVVTVFVGISLISQEVGEWAAEKWGPFWGALVQIGTAIALTWGVGAFTGIPFLSPTTLIGQVGLVGSYITMGMAAYTEHAYEALSEKQQAWMDYINQPNDPLEQVEDLLEEMFPDLNIAQKAILPHPETLDEFLGRTLATTEGLTGRLLMPITDMAQLTLTPRLI